MHPGHDLLIVDLAHRGLDDLAGGQQIAEVEFTVLQDLLDVLGRETRPQAQAGEWNPLGFVQDLMPGVEHRAQRRPGVARRGLHEDAIPTAATLQRGHQQHVEGQAPGQA